MNKTIGIPGWMMEGKYFGVTVSYIEFLSQFGKLRIITPQDVDSPPDVDLLVLPGGADIFPLSYGAMPGFRTNAPNLMLEFFDEKILPQYLDNGTKTFSICRGAQKLFSLFGGELIQHYPCHKQSSHPTDEAHELAFTPDFSEYSQLIGKVTSRHHQVMNGLGTIPDELQIVAYSNEKISGQDNINKTIVEIFKHRNDRIWGVQFHSEDHSTDRFSSEIIRKLLGE